MTRTKRILHTRSKEGGDRGGERELDVLISEKMLGGAWKPLKGPITQLGIGRRGRRKGKVFEPLPEKPEVAPLRMTRRKKKSQKRERRGLKREAYL